MAVRLQRGTMPASCVSSTEIFKPPVLNCQTQPLLHMVQHVADSVTPFRRSQHYHPPSLKEGRNSLPPPLPPLPSSSPLHLPPLLPSLTGTRVRGNHHHQPVVRCQKSCPEKVSVCKVSLLSTWATVTHFCVEELLSLQV